MDKLIYKSYENLVSDIKSNIFKLSKGDFDLVVGIPRSGMIPAYLISAFMNIDVCDVDSFIENKKLQRGITRTTKASLSYPQEAKNVLLVDDSIYSGDSLRTILDKLSILDKHQITTCVIYATGIGKSKVDIFFEAVEGKKLFEWGIFHNNVITKTCFDMDGVLCRDCLPEQNDEGPLYLDFIKNVEPLFIPTGKIYAIITNRLEKYREETVAWLARYNVQYEQLIMLDLPNKFERSKIDAGIEHKGKKFKALKDSVLFIESSYNQSLSIARVAGKPVYCVDRNCYLDPDMSSKLLNNTGGFLRDHYYGFKHKVKMFLIKDKA